MLDDLELPKVKNPLTGSESTLSLLDGHASALSCLQEGLKSSSIALLKESAERARQAIQELDDKDTPLAASLRRILGTALCKAYEFEGKLTLLQNGLEELRNAHSLAQRLQWEEFYKATSENLLMSLVRAGEQTGDLTLLREALLLAEEIEARRDGEAPDFAIINAKAVAMLRVGAYAADPALVRQAITILRTLLEVSSLSQEGRNQTQQNLCAALMGRARQQNNPTAYRDVLAFLEPFDMPFRDNLTAHFGSYRAVALSELGALIGSSEMGEEALKILNLLVAWHAPNPFRKLEALHALAQAHFRLGKQSAAPASHLQEAVDAIERALALTGVEAKELDSRRHRLLADLGAYKYALGIATKGIPVIVEAEAAYRAALEYVKPWKSPSLYIAVAKGLFTLLFLEEKWDAALAVFAEMEGAWDRILADSQLSGAVHAQGARELAGQYSRAAWAMMKLERLADAVLTLERGRARQLQINLRVGQEIEGIKIEDEDVKRARAAVAEATSSGSDAACVVAWENYLSVRRRKGLDTNAERLSWQSAIERIPVGGAIIQLFSTERGVAALVLCGQTPQLDVIHFPNETRDHIATLVGRASGDGTWLTSHKQFVDRTRRWAESLQPLTTEESAYDQWSTTVENTCKLLGREILIRIHERLQRASLQPNAEIILSPPGELAYFPIAASILPDGSTMGDHWSFSVTPCISTLPAKSFIGDMHRLMIIPPPLRDTNGFRALPFAVREAELVARRVPPGSGDCLSREATIKDALRALGSGTIVHAACHGVFDRRSPEKSGLELTEGRLTLPRLTQRFSGNESTRLVVLSSCESAIVGLGGEPDEFVGLPASLLQSGARAVVGTLWAVFDDTAMLVADQFYANYLDTDGRERMPPARALALSILWLRNITVKELVDLNFFSEKEAQAQFVDRSRSVTRLRGLAIEDDEADSDDALDNAGMTRRLGEILDAKPYASPTEWAAFAAFGR